MAYTFGRLGGLLSYSFPPARRPNTKIDRLSFGFTTKQRDAALVTVTSSSYADFIHVELVGYLKSYTIPIAKCKAYIPGDCVLTYGGRRYRISAAGIKLGIGENSCLYQE